MAYLPNKFFVPEPVSAAVDSFGRLRVSEPYTIFDCQFQRDKQPLLFDEVASGGAAAATWNSNAHAVDMTLGVVNGEQIVRQTFQYHRYQPLKSQLAVVTGLFGAPKANVRKRVGYFDSNDGVFLEVTGTEVALVLRSATSGAPVDTRILQANWNVDTFDGAGPSGIVLDLDSTQILSIDLEWLGVGSIRYAFVIDGQTYIAHVIKNANNSQTVPYMRTACLPIRLEITNTGVPGSSTTLRQICSSVASEGSFNPYGIPRAASTGPAGKALSIVAFVPLVSIRMKAADVRSQIELISATFAASSAQEYLLQLYWNPSLTGPAWTSLGPNSITEFDVTASALTGGTIIGSAAMAGAQELTIPLVNLLRLGATIAGTADILTIAAQQRIGGGVTAIGTLNFKELF